jgi:hypothetical protein
MNNLLKMIMVISFQSHDIKEKDLTARELLKAKSCPLLVRTHPI